MTSKAPVFITGIPRSGASAIAATINLCGAFGGVMSKRSRYTNDRICNEIVKPYFAKANADQEGHYPLLQNINIPFDWKSRVDQIIYEEGFNHGLWMYKDSRLSLMWPVWDYAYPNAKWVIVRRKTSDILNSCMKTGYMIRFRDKKVQEQIGITDEREGWLWMIHQYENEYVRMIQDGVNCKIIWPERMVDGNYQQIYELCDWLGLPWKEESLKFINPLLWGSNQKKERKVV